MNSTKASGANKLRRTWARSVQALGRTDKAITTLNRHCGLRFALATSDKRLKITWPLNLSGLGYLSFSYSLFDLY